MAIRRKLVEPEQPVAADSGDDDESPIYNSQYNTLTIAQGHASRLFKHRARHTALVGGARSGKTTAIVRQMVIRAIRAPGSRHLIFRLHSVDAWTSVGLDTFPKVMTRFFPDLEYHVNASYHYFVVESPYGYAESEIWIGGVADKEQADKILGKEYSTIFANEISQITYPTIVTVRSRLAQVSKTINGTLLRQKFFYDLNPVGKGHWSNVEFGEKRSPVNKKPLDNAEDFQRMFINPEDNKKNLTPEYLRELAAMPARQRARYYEGKYVDEMSNALWTFEQFERGRIKIGTPLPDFDRIVVAVDPSGAANEMDETHDAIGIVVAARGVDGHAYVLDDRTLLGSPKQWARAALNAYKAHGADCIVAEVNFGGAMVENTLTVESRDEPVKIKVVTASRGKVARAEPVSALYGDPADPNAQDKPPKVHHVGVFEQLEDEMSAFTDQGYTGPRSPNRADALVWALSELMLGPSVAGWMQWAKNRAAELTGKTVDGKGPTFVKVKTPNPHMNFMMGAGIRYSSGDDSMIYRVDTEHLPALIKAGCVEVKEESA